MSSEFVPFPVGEISFTVNGTQYKVINPDPTMSLNEWIRDQPGLQGTFRILDNIVHRPNLPFTFNL